MADPEGAKSNPEETKTDPEDVKTEAGSPTEQGDIPAATSPVSPNPPVTTAPSAQSKQSAQPKSNTTSLQSLASEAGILVTPQKHRHRCDSTSNSLQDA